MHRILYPGKVPEFKVNTLIFLKNSSSKKGEGPLTLGWIIIHAY